MSDLTSRQYQQLINSISNCLVSGQQSAVQQVNRALVETYWTIGRYIVEFEQQGQERAEYGSRLLARLSKDLKQLHGLGCARDRSEASLKPLVVVVAENVTTARNHSTSH